MNQVYQEFQNYLKNIDSTIDINDFTTIERSYKHSLRFELGDDLENGTIERVKQAVSRSTEIFAETFKNEDELYVLAYEWEDEIFARTPDYLDKILGGFDFSIQCDLALMHNMGEEVEVETGRISICKRMVKEIDSNKILIGISNAEMGFNPTIHQITYFFGLNTKIAFWMYDDRGCLVMSQSEIDNLKMFEDWLCDGY